MTRRLILGCGSVGRAVVEAVASWPGELDAVVADRGRTDALRDDTVDAVLGDPADPSNYPDAVDVVFVAGNDPEANLAAARSARDAFQSALVVAHVPVAASDETRAAVESVADRVVDARSVLATRALDVASDETTERMARLLRALRGVDGRLAVVAHDNPDPDAIASALALVRIAASVGVAADACHFGDISHQENRALVNLLDIELRTLSDPGEIDEYDAVALVDHSRPGVNDGLDPGTDVAIVIDHHPPRVPITAEFVDLRSDVGATSTLLTEYLERLGIEPDRVLATALLFGIRVDTKDFTREVSDTDYEAAAFLLGHADAATLNRVEAPSMNAEVLDTLGRAVRNRDVRGTTLVTGVGEIRDRDVLAQAADRLLEMDGVRLSLVYGFADGTVYVSGRARGTDIDLGETLRDALGAIGSAGGHADMAGAQVPLGILEDVADGSKEQLARVVDDVIKGRFFETLESGPRTLVREPDTKLAREYSQEESG
jgi:nanoRNase/pAp phosphatase (c-di-AMP/oligoRNAs hydrolase)